MGNKAKRRSYTYKETVKFVPPVTTGQVVKVYDGDTFTLATVLPLKNDSTVYRFSVRVLHIDCPELRGPHTDDTEHDVAIIARDFVHELIFDKYVVLENVSTDKYGRLLADVYIDGKRLDELLLDAGLAVPYEGRTKQAPDSWLEYYENRN